MQMAEARRDWHADAHLARRLLRGGVGLRHVRRTLRELRDHRADLVDRMVERGQDHAAATCEARQLLGDRDALAAQMIARPELRSRARRFAWLLFVLGPLPMVLVAGLMALLAATAIVELTGVGFLEAAASNTDLATIIIRLLLQWVAPTGVGLLLCCVATRRMVLAIWPVCATAIIALVSSSTRYFVSAVPGSKSANIHFFGGSFIEWQRAILVFCALGIAYLLLRRAQLRTLDHV